MSKSRSSTLLKPSGPASVGPFGLWRVLETSVKTMYGGMGESHQ